MEIQDKTVLAIQDKTVEILGEAGIISRRLQSYELRSEQLQMAKTIGGAIEDNKHLIIEAGTGVGKSLAYLIPFIIYTTENDKKVIVSTNTKTLQHQLYLKDIPFLRESLKVDFNYALCLGSENYLCKRRLNNEYTYELFDKDMHLEELRRIAEWSKETDTGIKSDLNFIPKNEVWSNVCREPDLCLGKKCLYRDDCFYREAKKKEKKSHILVTNHALFFTNLASGGQVLPDFDAVVFDEAQTLEDAATSYLGLEASNTKIKYFFDSIYNPNTKKGLLIKFKILSAKAGKEIEKNLVEARYTSDRFFHEIGDIFGQESASKRIRTKNITFNYLEEPLKRLRSSLAELLDYVDNKEDETLIKSFLKNCNSLSSSLDFILKQERNDYVYWIEVSARKRGVKYSLFASPIEIAEELDKQLFSKVKPIILTSATLSINNSFDFIKGRLGIKGARQLRAGSSFNYKENVLLYFPRAIKDPNDEFELFRQKSLEEIKRIIDIMKGRIFILFTSYHMLNAVYQELSAAYQEINLLRQGEKPRYILLEEFKNDQNSVLLGTSTFWQGIDVPGKPLECVIITKLPFSVPDDPITEARMELIQQKGKNPFIEYQVPQAIMMFKQGFGRLIRTKKDRGVVAILDPRIRTRYYGRSFMNSIPKCRHTVNADEIDRFFNKAVI
ncbi:MAG: DEAD/DEAH box helicase [Candidatus Omnitrophica bacterium]|nr:DEAD/DEAH box helicase [Candidatus Omnitrophota bacterium]